MAEGKSRGATSAVVMAVVRADPADSEADAGSAADTRRVDHSQVKVRPAGSSPARWPHPASPLPLALLEASRNRVVTEALARRAARGL